MDNIQLISIQPINTASLREEKFDDEVFYVCQTIVENWAYEIYGRLNKSKWLIYEKKFWKKFTVIAAIHAVIQKSRNVFRHYRTVTIESNIS